MKKTILKQNNFRLIVNEEFAGLRLDRFLSDVPDLKSFIPTRSFAQNIIEKNFVSVNNLPSKPSYNLKLKDLVEVNLPEKQPSTLTPFNYKLDVIYEDDHLIVINKPAGLVVHPAAGHEQDTLVNALLNHTQNLSMKNEERPGIVHRIDKETSGLLVVAKNDEAHEHLSNQFKNKTTHRIYYAIVSGTLEKNNGTLQSYLARHLTDRKKYSSVKINNKILTKFDPTFEKGKWAVTHYSTVEYSQNKTLVKVKLETGRTHQIRVHMSELRHPLVGDTVYGFSLKQKNDLKIDRFFLHAAELGFVHPKTGEKLLFKVNWPKADQQIIHNWGFSKYELDRE